MSLLSRLFGGGGAAKTSTEAEPAVYHGFAITPTPIREGGRYRIAALIQKEVGGEVKTYKLIRADVLDSETAAADASVAKARQLIDEQGERLFG